MSKYPRKFEEIITTIDTIIKEFSHIKKDLDYGYRWTFDNKMWFDVIDYKNVWKYTLRIGRGAWLVKKYPILYGMFDEVLTVITKYEIISPETLYEKNFSWLIKILNEAPAEIGVYDK